MKVKIIVTLKSGVLDPKGKAIQQTLNSMGFGNVKEVRQGRYIVEINKNKLNKVKEILKNNSVHFDELGVLKEKDIEVDSESVFKLEDLKKEYKSWLKKYMIN